MEIDYCPGNLNSIWEDPEVNVIKGETNCHPSRVQEKASQRLKQDPGTRIRLWEERSQYFDFWSTWDPQVKALVTQLCLTVCARGLQPARLLCPWDSSGKNTGVGCHALIFLTQGSNLGLLHFRWILYHLRHQGSPLEPTGLIKIIDGAKLLRNQNLCPNAR